MSYLKRIDPGSAFKVGALVYAIVGLIAGVFCGVIAFAAPSVHHAHMPWVSPSVGLFAVLLCPTLYGIIGGIGAIISALIFNLASGWVGGLEVEIN